MSLVKHKQKDENRTVLTQDDIKTIGWVEEKAKGFSIGGTWGRLVTDAMAKPLKEEEEDCPNCKHHGKNFTTEEPCKSCTSEDRASGYEYMCDSCHQTKTVCDDCKKQEYYYYFDGNSPEPEDEPESESDDEDEQEDRDCDNCKYEDDNDRRSPCYGCTGEDKWEKKSEPEDDSDHDCPTCKYEHEGAHKNPCKDCGDNEEYEDNWEPKPESENTVNRFQIGDYVRMKGERMTAVKGRVAKITEWCEEKEMCKVIGLEGDMTWTVFTDDIEEPHIALHKALEDQTPVKLNKIWDNRPVNEVKAFISRIDVKPMWGSKDLKTEVKVIWETGNWITRPAECFDII